MAAGSHLTIFGWLIALALREHDMTTGAIITVAMILLCVWNGLQLTQRPYFHMMLCCAVVIAVINLRLDVWTAASYGVSVAEIHNRIPFWIVPLSTFALVGWVAGMLVATKPKLP
jgi:hypothetical protein